MRLIDEEAFLKTEIDRCGSAPLVGTCTSDNEYLSEKLKKAPTIEAKPVVHGRWIYKGDSDMWVCSRCGRSVNADPEGIDLYCYHCGAKMDEKEDR